MSTNTLPPHTDTVPHYWKLSHEVFEFHETALPHTIAILRGGVVLLHLGDELTMEHLPSNGATDGGDITPAPIFSDEWIGYGQTRGFERYNIRTHEFHDQLVCTKLEEVVKACRAIDPSKNIFAFMIERYSETTLSTRFFKIFDLSNPKPLLLAKVEAGDYRYEDRGESVIVRDSTLFYIHETQKKLIAYNLKLEETKHPFADAYNEHYKKLLNTRKITVHPYLPFAMVENGLEAAISWKDNKKDLFPFLYIEKDQAVSDFNFSHDGKYISWMSETTIFESGIKPKYYAARVDEKIPGYIGKPILLGTTTTDPDSKAPLAMGWAQNPNTFVVSEWDGIYWWHIE